VERELLGLIGEQRELLFINWTLQQLDKEGKRVCLINRVKWPAGKLAIQKVFFFFKFCGLCYIFPTVDLLLPFLWKRSITIICFLPLVNSWAQVKGSVAFQQKQLLSLCYTGDIGNDLVHNRQPR
jgi:hypothetical protein